MFKKNARLLHFTIVKNYKITLSDVLLQRKFANPLTLKIKISFEKRKIVQLSVPKAFPALWKNECFKIWNSTLFQKKNVPAGNCFWKIYYLNFSTFRSFPHFYSWFCVSEKEEEGKVCLFRWFSSHYRRGFREHFGFFENINFLYSNLSWFGLFACNKINGQSFILT